MDPKNSASPLIYRIYNNKCWLNKKKKKGKKKGFFVTCQKLLQNYFSKNYIFIDFYMEFYIVDNPIDNNKIF